MSDNDQQSRPVKAIITLGAIATAILAVLTLYTFFFSPAARMSGTLSDITIENSNEGIFANYVVEIKGFKDQKCTLELSVYDAEANFRVGGPWLGTELIPESNEDRASEKVYVPVEATTSTYFVRLELYDPDHVRLDYKDSEPFFISSP